MRTSSLLLLSAVAPLVAAKICPVDGAVFPPAECLSCTDEFEEAKETLLATLQNDYYRQGPYLKTLNFDTLSYAIQVFSLDEEEPLVQSYHTAPGIRKSTVGTQAVYGDTIFRIGSISKLWTVLLMLIEKGDAPLHEPVAKYVPELRAAALDLRRNGTQDNNSLDHLRWEQVTIGELASHLSGLTREYAVGDFAQGPTPDGLPHLPKSAIPPCGGTVTCTRSQFFDGVLSSHPLVPTGSVPIYSNPAFQILGYALEAMTGKTYQQLLEHDLIKPLHLKSSSYDKPTNDNLAIIPAPPAQSFYGVDAGDETPAGGLYSSPNDLATLGRAILKSSLLPPPLTRRWMKPLSRASDRDIFVGAPWEIATLTEPRVTDIYTKSGNLGMYSSMLALSPDHKLGFVIMTAGENSAAQTNILADLVLTTLIPAVENAARTQADFVYSGTYESTKYNSSLTISVDSHPGLKVDDWISQGENVMFELAADMGIEPDDISVRLYPSGLREGKEIGFRAVFQDRLQAQRGGIGPFTNTCQTWVMSNAFRYGNVGLDEFVFTLGGMRGAKSVKPRAWRTEMERVSRGDEEDEE